jgi:two-component system, OmpR family, response regulator MprA
MEARILIFARDEEILQDLQKSLAGEDYEIHSVFSLEAVLLEASQLSPDLLILDLDFFEVDIPDFCSALRAQGDASILIISRQNKVGDRILGLDSGADDFIGIPFDGGELQARIRALLRRNQKNRSNVLTIGDLVMNTSTRQVERAGEIIHLTAKEFDLLKLFMHNPRRVMSREEIFDRVWGYDFGGVSNVLDVYIRYLRQKLEKKGAKRLIHTMRGVGYVLREEP